MHAYTLLPGYIEMDGGGETVPLLWKKPPDHENSVTVWEHQLTK